MYTPWRSAASMTSSPGRASTVRPSTVIEIGSGIATYSALTGIASGA